MTAQLGLSLENPPASWIKFLTLVSNREFNDGLYSPHWESILCVENMISGWHLTDKLWIPIHMATYHPPPFMPDHNYIQNAMLIGRTTCNPSLAPGLYVRTEGVTSIELSNLSLAPGLYENWRVSSMELSLFRAIELTLVTIGNQWMELLERIASTIEWQRKLQYSYSLKITEVFFVNFEWPNLILKGVFAKN